MEIEVEKLEKPLYLYICLVKKIICKSNLIMPDIPETSDTGLIGTREKNNRRKKKMLENYVTDLGYTELEPEEFSRRFKLGD